MSTQQQQQQHEREKKAASSDNNDDGADARSRDRGKWVVFNYYGEERRVGPVPAALYNDLSTVISYIRRQKGKSKLSEERHAALDEALTQSAGIRGGIQGLAQLMGSWKESAREAFSALSHYTEQRAVKYTAWNQGSQDTLTAMTCAAAPWLAAFHQQQLALTDKQAQEDASTRKSQGAHRSLSSANPLMVLDIGCGTGLSTEYATRWCSPRPAPGDGRGKIPKTEAVAINPNHRVYAIGIDISAAMLTNWVSDGELAGFDRQGTDAPDACKEAGIGTIDRVQCDFNQGLPFREGAFDGFFGVSSIHFLTSTSHSQCESPETRCNRFFRDLRAALHRHDKEDSWSGEERLQPCFTRDAALGGAFQLFPQEGEEVSDLNALVGSAKTNGFAHACAFGHWAHHTNGIRWFISLRAQSSLDPPSQSIAEDASSLPATPTITATTVSKCSEASQTAPPGRKCLLLELEGFKGVSCCLCPAPFVSQALRGSRRGRAEVEWTVAHHCKAARKLVRTLLWQRTRDAPVSSRSHSQQRRQQSGTVQWKTKHRRKDKGNKQLTLLQQTIAAELLDALGDEASLDAYISMYDTVVDPVLHTVL